MIGASFLKMMIKG
jgi:hypothetical protein